MADQQPPVMPAVDLPLTGDLLAGILREYARAKIQHMHILNYNGANLAYNHAADIANKLKLSEAQKMGIAPFPPNPTNVVINMENAEEKPSTLPAALTGPVGSAVGKAVGMGLVGGPIAAGLVYLGTLLSQQPAAQTVPATNRGNVGLEVQGWQTQNK